MPPNLYGIITAFTMSSHHQTLTRTSLVSFPSVIQAWNNLPISLIETNSLQHFISNLNQ